MHKFTKPETVVQNNIFEVAQVKCYSLHGLSVKVRAWFHFCTFQPDHSVIALAEYENDTYLATNNIRELHKEVKPNHGWHLCFPL